MKLKDGYVQKSTDLNSEELLKINAFSKAQLKEEDVYTFSVVLCDNEIDRDFERFTTDSLYTLASMFIGKTGIFDHSQKGVDQTARIYDCNVEISSDKLNCFGEPYACLKAKAYMPRIEKNTDLICEIDAGIKKEVSVGCAVGVMRCSVCGADVRHEPCEHRRGDIYNGLVCCTELIEPTDAYEWSFVAVPAQPLAGVTKHFTPQDDEVKKLKEYINSLEKEAQIGREFKQFQAEELIKLISITAPNADCTVLKKAARNLNAMEICELKKLFESVIAESICKSQFEEHYEHFEEEMSKQSFLI